MTKVYNVTTYGIALQLQKKLQTVYFEGDFDSKYSKGAGKNIQSNFIQRECNY